MHLPVEIMKIQAGYLTSTHFKDIYLYLSQNKLPTSKIAIRKVETLAEKYILLDSLLFKITPEKETVVLAVPEMCTYKVIPLYHCSLLTGHQGVIKAYLTNFYAKPYTLSQVLHKRMSHMPVSTQ